MKIALIGHGKMGRLIEHLAKAKGHQIVSKFNSQEPFRPFRDSWEDADIGIDFSIPSKVLKHIEWVASLGKNLVVGTTGWYDRIDQAKKIIENYGTGLVYSPNFSIGVHIFLKIVEQASLLINQHENYDVAGFEVHHAQKFDSPSGTAEAMMSKVMKNIKRKEKVKINSSSGVLEKNEIALSSLRCGSIPGKHGILFDSKDDTIQIKHTARTREGFANGALTAAEWILDKKGFFTLEDLLNL